MSRPVTMFIILTLTTCLVLYFIWQARQPTVYLQMRDGDSLPAYIYQDDKLGFAITIPKGFKKQKAEDNEVVFRYWKNKSHLPAFISVTLLPSGSMMPKGLASESEPLTPEALESKFAANAADTIWEKDPYVAKRQIWQDKYVAVRFVRPMTGPFIYVFTDKGIYEVREGGPGPQNNTDVLATFKVLE